MSSDTYNDAKERFATNRRKYRPQPEGVQSYMSDGVVAEVLPAGGGQRGRPRFSVGFYGYISMVA
jgi:hypothetical protein